MKLVTRCVLAILAALIVTIMSQQPVIELRIKTHLEYYVDHKHAYRGDSGIDLFIPYNVTIPAHAKSHTVPLLIACEMVEHTLTHTTPVSYYIYPRSSLAKTPIRFSPGVGVIDAGYRGILTILVDNHSDKEYVIQKGSRLVQICHQSLRPITVRMVKRLSHSERGEAGMGSSGM